MHRIDEGIRFDASLEAIRGVKLLQEGGRITAATSSQIGDGASGVMVVNEKGLKALGVQPLARIHHMTVIGHDPVIMLEAPIPATALALKKAGMKLDDIDLFEVNEAFASVPVAWLQQLHADPGKLNVNGGAIALGHPLGASGTKLMTTLVHALKAARQALRPADDVRRRRPVQRHDHREAVAMKLDSIHHRRHHGRRVRARRSDGARARGARRQGCDLRFQRREGRSARERDRRRLLQGRRDLGRGRRRRLRQVARRARPGAHPRQLRRHRQRVQDRVARQDRRARSSISRSMPSTASSRSTWSARSAASPSPRPAC